MNEQMAETTKKFAQLLLPDDPQLRMTEVLTPKQYRQECTLQPFKLKSF
jgi:hypothetical protein